jgi:hypothetical protein
MVMSGDRANDRNTTDMAYFKAQFQHCNTGESTENFTSDSR